MLARLRRQSVTYSLSICCQEGEVEENTERQTPEGCKTGVSESV